MEIRTQANDEMSWGESFDRLLESEAGQQALSEFLKTEYSEENILFWLACEDFRKITSVPEMTSAANRIYTEFVHVDAPRQVNIDCVTREDITANMSRPTLNTFDKAQRLIYRLMARDCYPRFLKSQTYLALLPQSESGSFSDEK